LFYQDGRFSALLFRLADTRDGLLWAASDFRRGLIVDDARKVPQARFVGLRGRLSAQGLLCDGGDISSTALERKLKRLAGMREPSCMRRGAETV
jgi:hypothetical protein